MLTDFQILLGFLICVCLLYRFRHLFTDDEPPPEPSDITVNKEFWKYGGDVFLDAQNSTRFRVHKDVLIRNSDVFRTDLQVLDSRRADADIVDGCPVLYVADYPDDLIYLLRVFYDDRANRMASRGLCVLMEVEALTRMAIKYQVADVRNDCVSRMRSFFTDQFADWDKHMSHGGSRSDSIRLEAQNEAISAVNLARLTGQHSMLPTALLLCCDIPQDELAAGVRLRNGRLDRLSPEDLKKCEEGRKTIKKAHLVGRGQICHFGTAGSDCPRKWACAEVLAGWLSTDRIALERCSDQFNLAEHELCDYYKLCEQCSVTVRASIIDYRRAFWKMLPSFFKLDDWP
ncbi:hypothetical protein BKA93DRAFT_830342 [Sparassis latifolia]